MKIYKITISIIDFDCVGPEGIEEIIENQKYPNHCISPNVISIEERDIGEFTDDHPLNLTTTFIGEFERIFSKDENI